MKLAVSKIRWRSCIAAAAIAAGLGLAVTALGDLHSAAPARPEDPRRLTLDDLRSAFAQDTTLTLAAAGVTITSFNYEHDGAFVEALTFRPAAGGPFPGLVLIPGYSRTALDYIPLGVNLAKEGFASAAITQPGFGRSEGPADFVGPRTIETLIDGYERLKREPYVDPTRMGIFGYSRGAMASAILATRLDDLGAAVSAAGIYDLRKEWETNPSEGIRANIEAETGSTHEALRERSALFMMEDLRCPLLILHGEKDENASVAQALALRDRLTELGKVFEIRIYPDRDHDIGRDNLNEALVDFFRRRLGKPQGGGEKAE
jgi:dipeptidyl aminopeptidase/acylaminoacyl peptidase